MNCWEYMKCGREEGGRNTKSLGVCIASVEKKVDGVNDGTNGGRCCWALVGTLCENRIQGTFAQKMFSCLNCEFHKIVWREQKSHNFLRVNEIKDLLRE